MDLVSDVIRIFPILASDIRYQIPQQVKMSKMSPKLMGWANLEEMKTYLFTHPFFTISLYDSLGNAYSFTDYIWMEPQPKVKMTPSKMTMGLIFKGSLQFNIRTMDAAAEDFVYNMSKNGDYDFIIQTASDHYLLMRGLTSTTFVSVDDDINKERKVMLKIQMQSVSNFITIE